MAEDFVKVYQAKNTTEAYFVKNLLADEGIEGFVEGEYLQGALGDLPWLAVAPQVMVRPASEEAARRIVREYDEQRSARAGSAAGGAGATWRCPKCGEEVDGDFEVCWNCQSARPGVE